MTRDEILKYYCNSINRINVKLVKKSESQNSDEYKALIRETSFMPTNRTTFERIHALRLNITNDPVCIICNKQTQYVGVEGNNQPMFRKTCSAKCAGVAKKGITIIRDEKTAKVKRSKTMIEKYGYEYNSMRPDVKSLLGIHNKNTEFKAKQREIQKAKHTHIDYTLVDSREKLYNLNKTHSTQKIADMCNSSYTFITHKFQHYNLKINKKHKSYPEQLICDFLDSINITYISNDRKVLNGKELDIFIPSHNIGIECNGVYWHSDKFIDSNYHIDKTTAAALSGVTLLQFWGKDIINKTDLVMSMIASKLNISQTRVYARKCVIKDVDVSSARAFCADNHIQGYSGASIKKGLYHNDTLVALATFAKPRFAKKYDYELIRFCVLKNHSVVGGFSKLMNIMNHVDVISYANMMISTGNVYEQNGFVLIKQNTPGFFYYNEKTGEVTSRQSDTRHHTLTRKNGKYRVFDCGNLVYVKYKKSTLN